MPMVSSEIRAILPVWAVALLLPIPMVTFWQEGPGRDFAYAYLFLGCSIMTAERFRRPFDGGLEHQLTSHGTLGLWRARMLALALATASAVCVFTAFAWAITGQVDELVPLFANQAVLPSLGCVPFVALRVGNPYSAVLFTCVLLAAVKLAGCVVVVIVYGWNAQVAGHLSLPWEQPNLLVWLCLGGSLACSAALYPLGRRAFLKVETAAIPVGRSLGQGA